MDIKTAAYWLSIMSVAFLCGWKFESLCVGLLIGMTINAFIYIAVHGIN